MSSHAHRLEQSPLKSTLRSRREAFWQIAFPVILVALIFIGLVVALFLTRGPQGVSIVADLALMLVIMPACVVGLLIVGLTGGIIYGVSWAINNVWPYTNIAQRGMNMTHRTVSKVTDQFTGFIIGGLAMLGGFANVLDQWMGTNGDEAQPTADTTRREE